MSKLNGNLSIFNQLKPVSVGFENMFDSFEKMFENDGFESLMEKMKLSIEVFLKGTLVKPSPYPMIQKSKELN